MNVARKIVLKLWKNFKILNYSLFTSSSAKLKSSNSKFLWSRDIASKCGAYPVYFPKRREITDTPMGNLFLLTPLFIWLSYKNINHKLGQNNSVFVSLNEMGAFMKYVLPKIKTPFVLVSGDSDYTTSKFKQILDTKYLIHWFSAHNDIRNKKVTSMPWGLDFHMLLTEDFFGEKMTSVIEQEKNLEKIINLRPKSKMKVFANFHLNCTRKRRNELHHLLKNNSCMYFQKSRMPRTAAWKLQKEFSFILSPAGNGPDAIRTWEALILGQIPIIERGSAAMDSVHKKFPIVLINDVSEINEENLKKWYKKYSKMFTPQMKEMLTNKYWIDLIKKKQFLKNYL